MQDKSFAKNVCLKKLMIEIQGYRCGTGESRQKSSGTGIALIMTVHLTANTGVAPVKWVPPAKVMSPWSGGTGISKFAGAAPLMTIQLTAIQGAV